MVSDVRFILQSALANQSDVNHSSHWWLGRLAFIDRLLSQFSWDFLLPQCQLNPQNQPSIANSDYDSDEKTSSTSDSISGPTSPIDSVSSSIASSLMVEGGGTDSQPHSFEFEPQAGMELANIGVELRQTGEEEEENEGASGSSPSPMPAVVANNLLMQVWYFAAKATHLHHHKLGKLAQKVIIKIAKGLQDDPASLEIVHDVVSKCSRTRAEGLLDRVLQARQKPLDPSPPSNRRTSGAAVTARLDDGREKDDGRSSPCSCSADKRRATSSSPDDQRAARRVAAAAAKAKAKKNRASVDVSHFHVETSYKHLGATAGVSFSPDTRGLRKTDTDVTLRADSPEYAGSEDSFQSAISDLDHRRSIMDDEEEEEKEEGSEETSSASNSHDSRAGRDPLSRSSSGYASVASGVSAVGGSELKAGAGGLMG